MQLTLNEYLTHSQGQLVDMSEEEFSRHKEALATKRLEKPKMMSTLSALFWSEISSQQYNFDRANVEVSYMRTIAKEIVIKFFKVYATRGSCLLPIRESSLMSHNFQEVVHHSSPTRHKLSVHVVSMAEGGAGRADPNIATVAEEEGSTPSAEEVAPPYEPCQIKDVMSFKSSQALYPLLKPFIDIPRKGTRSKL